MRRIQLAALCLMTISLAAPASAQDWRVMLSRAQEARLNPDAKVYFDQADEEIDRVNYDGALVLLAKAAEIDNKNVPLQFLVAARARNRAEIYYSEASYTPAPSNMEYSSPPWRTAEPYLAMADSALNRIATNPEITTEDRARLAKEQQMLEARRGTLAERDKARVSTAEPLVSEIREQRKTEASKSQTAPEDDVLNVANALKPSNKKPEDQKKSGEKFDPFSLLPGEYIQPFLPPPPPPNAGYGYGGPVATGVLDPYANPASAPAFEEQGGPPPPPPDFNNEQGGAQAF